MSLIYNATFDKNTRKLSFEDRAGNEIYSFIVPERGSGSVDDITKPLTFKATQDGSTVKLNKLGSPTGSFQTSRDGGNTWADYTIDDVITLNTGDEVSFRAKADRSAPSPSYYFYFYMTGKIEAWHNVMSMLRTNDFSTYKSVIGYAFSHLFYGCRSLTKAPKLPATTLADSCYWCMFDGCRSLKKAPVLPATTLAVDCYWRMFAGCQSLTKAPVLPATTLAERCYLGMFSGCRSLKEVRISAATTTATDALEGWLKDVSATGDFYCDPNATIFPTDSTSGIPLGWTRRDINLLNALTLTATADNSSVKLTKNGTLDNTFEVDTGNGWTAYEFDTVIPLNAGQSCKWRCSAHPTTQSYSNYVNFVMTGTIEASGNCNSMLSSDFDGITSLTGYDYAFMSLFINCTSLTKAPGLPATALSPSCYRSMFLGCESLVKSPELPATTLANDCYFQMFTGCKSLVKSPELPATTLADYCYRLLFFGCSKLNEVRISATTKATDALDLWLANVPSTGDFYCDPNATIFPADSPDGIPKGWTRHALADYPATP